LHNVFFLRTDIYSLDHSGHGRSEGEPRGYIEKFDHYVEDLVAYIKKSQQVYLDRGQLSFML